MFRKTWLYEQKSIYSIMEVIEIFKATMDDRQQKVLSCTGKEDPTEACKEPSLTRLQTKEFVVFENNTF